MNLKRRLIEQILRDGPMPFEEFQRIALYDPDEGFFGSGKLRSTKDGDFLTSPEVSPLFGEMLARFVDQVILPPQGEVGSARNEPRSMGVSPTSLEPQGSFFPPEGGKYRSGEAAGVGGSRPKDAPLGEVGSAPPSEVGHNHASPSGGSAERSEAMGVSPTSLPLLVEVGAGSGSLLKPLLATLETPVDAWAVEASPAARESLKRLLPPDHVVDALDTITAPFSGVIIANELLDNLPVALAVRTSDGWQERWAGVEGDDLVLVPHEARPEVADWADRFGLPCPVGGQVEVQVEAAGWLRHALDLLETGAVVLIDYGDVAENLEHRRAEGTLRTYRGHHLGPDPLLDPGQTDITVDVNFSALLAAAEEAGATAELYRQDEFLTSLGLRERIRELQELEWERARAGDTMGQLKARSDRTGAETLLHPRGLGDFRVLVVRK